LSTGPTVHAQRSLITLLQSLLCMGLWCVMTCSAFAQEPANHQLSSDVMDGRFIIARGETGVTNDVLLLDAEIIYGLTRGAREALENGVPLTFETQIELDRVRRYLPDPTLVTLIQRFELNYHALTQRFIVRNVNSSEQSSHATLSSALFTIGQLQALRSYAAPLRMLAALFRVDDWRLESPWERWLVTI